MVCELKKYPYFIYPAITALRENRTPGADTPLSDEEVNYLRRFISANVGDIPSLRLILGIDPEEFAEFYPDMLPPALSTADTIDSFLTHFGDASAPTPRAAAEIPVEDFGNQPTLAGVSSEESGIPLETAVYSLEEETAGMAEATIDDTTASAIDSFLSNNPRPSTDNGQRTTDNGQQTTDKGQQTTEFSESNARNLIKNHDYQTALAIIQQLSLNNPEKSIYFADQIRFLRKLILNQAQKNN